MTADTPHYLYRHFDADGKLLYVGITLNPESRQLTHRTTTPWRHLIATITQEMHPSLAIAEAYERHDIRTKVPLYNVSHSPDREAAKKRVAELAAYHEATRPTSEERERAELERIVAAGREAAKDAPPLSAEQLEMLRRDRCPIFARNAERSAA